MTDLPADVRDVTGTSRRSGDGQLGRKAPSCNTARWFRDLDEGPAPRSYYEGAADEPGLAGTRWLWETAFVAGEIIAVKQIEVPPDGVARCYWWPHLGHDLGFLTGQPLDPDGWQLRTVDRGIFYQFWDSPGR